MHKWIFGDTCVHRSQGLSRGWSQSWVDCAAHWQLLGTCAFATTFYFALAESLKLTLPTAHVCISCAWWLACMVACCMAWLLMRVSLVSARPPPSRVRKSLPGYEGSNLRGLVPMHDACACGLRCPPPLLAGHAIQTSCARCLLPVCSRIFKVRVVCVLFVTSTQRGCGRLHAALSVRH
jgi:hypothetical protein